MVAVPTIQDGSTQVAFHPPNDMVHRVHPAPISNRGELWLLSPYELWLLSPQSLSPQSGVSFCCCCLGTQLLAFQAGHDGGAGGIAEYVDAGATHIQDAIKHE